MGATKQMTFALTKTRITNHKVEWLHSFSKFSNVEDFNNEYEQIMVDKKKKFTKVQHAILNVIRRYACKVPGISGVSYKKINIQLHKILGHTVHDDTIRRTLNKAEKMGIILKCGGKRINGSYTANVIIFNRYDEMRAYEIAAAEKEEQEIKKRIEEEFKEMSPALQFAHNAKVWAQEKAEKEAEKAAEEKRKAKQAKVASFEAHKTDYQKLKDELTNVFKDEKTVYKVYGAWKAQTNRMINKPDFKLAIEAARVLKMEIKKRYNSSKAKPIQNEVAYYNRTLSNLIDKWLEERIYNSLVEEDLL